MKNWQQLDSKQVFHCPIFSVRRNKNCSLLTGHTHDFYVIEPTNWVNVVAITPTDEIVLIKQYRHGSATITLEIPGGMVDNDETPLTAAQRELREETGYQAKGWHLLGINDPNPAIQNNRCYTFLAQQAILTDQQQLDHTEDIDTCLLPLTELANLVTTGKITHALVITAFYYYDLFRRGLIAG